MKFSVKANLMLLRETNFPVLSEFVAISVKWSHMGSFFPTCHLCVKFFNLPCTVPSIGIYSLV